MRQMVYNISDITFESLRRDCRSLKKTDIALLGGYAIVKVLADIYHCSESKIRYTLKHYRQIYKDCEEIIFDYSINRNQTFSPDKRAYKKSLAVTEAKDFQERKHAILDCYDQAILAAKDYICNEIVAHKQELEGLKFASEGDKEEMLESHEFYLSFKLWNLANKIHPKLPKYLLNFSKDLKESIEQHKRHEAIIQSLEENIRILNKKSLKSKDICIVMQHLEKANEYFSKSLL